MTDFKLTSTGDIDISSGGFKLVDDGLEGTQQELIIRLKSVQGNWFLGLNEGLPYFARIFLNSPNEADIYELLTTECLRTRGLLKTNFELELEPVQDSLLTVNIKGETADGVLTSAATLDFS